MPAIVADADSEGCVRRLADLLLDGPWRELWLELDYAYETFSTLGLAADASDAEIWRTCQQEQVVLITANRNQEGPDSLEATIRADNTAESLPVITLANPKRIMSDREYGRRVAEKLLNYLFDIDSFRGTGRLYVP
jgi:hypothetical protein